MRRRLAGHLASWYQYEQAWTGLDMNSWERSYRRWTTAAAWLRERA